MIKVILPKDQIKCLGTIQNPATRNDRPQRFPGTNLAQPVNFRYIYSLSICLSSIYQSIIYLFVYHLSICLSTIYLSIIYLSVSHLSIRLPFYLSIYQSTIYNLPIYNLPILNLPIYNLPIY